MLNSLLSKNISECNDEKVQNNKIKQLELEFGLTLNGLTPKTTIHALNK